LRLLQRNTGPARWQLPVWTLAANSCFLGDLVALRSEIVGSRRNGTKKEEPMNAAVQKVPPSFKVVKWGVPPDKLDQLAALLGLNDAQKSALKSGGDVVVAQDPQKT
jgi:hypothetical protein